MIKQLHNRKEVEKSASELGCESGIYKFDNNTKVYCLADKNNTPIMMFSCYGSAHLQSFRIAEWANMALYIDELIAFCRENNIQMNSVLHALGFIRIDGCGMMAIQYKVIRAVYPNARYEHDETGGVYMHPSFVGEPAV